MIKLRTDRNIDTEDLIREVLRIRGIEDVDSYLAMDYLPEHWGLLDNIDKAVDCLIDHIGNDHRVSILVDCDNDGVTSAALLYNYLMEYYKGIREPDLHLVLHGKNKAHGLSANDVVWPEGTKLVVIPDGGTNDADECNALIAEGVDVIILDHHEADPKAYENKAILVNNQMSPCYPHKFMSGAGIVWEFCRALDDAACESFADNYVDLAACGIIGDSMEVRDQYVRTLIERGLTHVRNKGLLGFIDANAYQMKGVNNMHTWAFDIVPFVNSVVRIGSMEERSVLMDAFIEKDDKTFDFKKRSGEVVQETIYEHVTRMAKNIKARQDKQRNKLVDILMPLVDDSRVSVVEVPEDLTDTGGIVGLAAIRIATALNKPVLLLKATEDGKLAGSARNVEDGIIPNLRDFVLNLGVFDFAQGHANAFGLQLDASNLDEARKRIADITAQMPAKADTIVDVIIPSWEMNGNIIYQVCAAANLWGKGVAEPVLGISKVVVNTDDIQVIGKNMDTVTFTDEAGVTYIKFGCKHDDLLMELAVGPSKAVNINIAGTCNLNDYNGNITPQIIVKDVETVI